jgi:hypothetical protein
MTMKTADGQAKETLRWRKPSLLRREYELWIGDTPLAWLRQSGWFPVQAHVFEQPKQADPVLQVARQGVWRQKLLVKTLDLRLPQVAPAALSWQGEARLALDNGRSYHLRPSNFWQMEWELRDEQGTLCFTLRRDTWGFGGEIRPGPASLSPDEWRLLLYLAWNVVIMKLDDQVVAAAG